MVDLTIAQPAHALLSPSGASRWLVCTRSARLEEMLPDTAGEAAREGTLAHKLAETLLAMRLRYISKKEYDKTIKEIKADALYSDAMLDHIETYVAFVLEVYTQAKVEAPDARIYLEQRFDLTKYIPEGFGTGDVCIVSSLMLRFIDLKYGQGVPVYCEENKQMKVYAVGAVEEHYHIWGFEEVELTIYQPRISNISTWATTVEDLMLWANGELKEKALLAFNDDGEFVPGDACRFCRAKAVCKANADYNLELAKHEFVNANLLTDEAIADILGKTDQFVNWLKAVNDYAFTQALAGKKWPGFKLVKGRSNRKYTDEAAIIKDLTEHAFYSEDVITTPRQLLGITALEKVVTKNDFEAFVNDYIVKPEGAPTLVPESDKRAEIKSRESAEDEFKVLD